MRIEESIFISEDGSKRHYRYAEVAGSDKLLLVQHGFHEHSGRYDEVIEFFAGQGFNVYAEDHRGHGRSDGKRGHVDSFDIYLKDIAALHRLATDKHKPKLTLLCGHSLGGLISLRYAQEYGDSVDGVITSGAFVELSVKVPLWKSTIARLLSRGAPSFTLPSGVDKDAVSSDPREVADYKADELVHEVASSRWFTEILANHRKVHERADRLRMPMLLLHGEADRIVTCGASRRLFPLLLSEKKKLITYPGMFHVIFKEVERVRVFEDITTWLAATGLV